MSETQNTISDTSNALRPEGLRAGGMTMFALVTGTISTAPTRRTTAKGALWVTFAIRVPSGEGSAFVNVATFDAALVETVLALTEGAAVSVQGRLELRTWQGRDGTERQGLSVTASELMHLKAPTPRKRTPKAHHVSQPTAQADPFRTRCRRP